MGYLHVEVETFQSSKHRGDPCGDNVAWHRDENALVVVLSDGLGHGTKANLASNMCCSRVLEMMRQGFTLREAFASVVHTMNDAWGSENPFAVFTVVQILNNGQTTILSYEMPEPVIVSRGRASVMKRRSFTVGKAVIGEVNYFIEPDESIFLMSDGVTQSGMGTTYVMGWRADGVAVYLSDLVSRGTRPRYMPRKIHDRAVRNWGEKRGDDVTVLMLHCRKGEVLNIMTGAPEDKGDDQRMALQFISEEGRHVVCGGTTTRIVARETGRKMKIVENDPSSITPPRYSVDGVELATEGAVTMNQVYNIMDEDDYPEISQVARLCEMLKNSDRINIYLGKARNLGSGDLMFRQQGILPRTTIVPLLCEKLKKRGKLVVLREF